jgi:hypothetical protein
MTMDYASQDYRDNAYGMSGVRQFLKKGKRDKDSKGKDKSADNPDNVSVGCEKGKPCPAYEGAGGASNQSNKGSGSTGKNKGAEGEKNEVMSPKEAKKWGKNLEKQREEEAKRKTQNSAFAIDRSKA